MPSGPMGESDWGAVAGLLPVRFVCCDREASLGLAIGDLASGQRQLGGVPKSCTTSREPVEASMTARSPRG